MNAPVRRGDAILLFLGIASVLAAVLGGLLWLLGPSSFLAPGRTAVLLSTGLMAVGSFGAVVTLVGYRGRTGPALVATAPRLFPLGSLRLNLAIYVLLLVAAGSIVHAGFNVYTGAYSGGNTAAVSDQSAVLALMVGASLVVWLLAVYMVLAIARMVRIGRAIEARRGPNAYGESVPAGEVTPEALDGTLAPPPPPLLVARPLIVATSVAFMLAISAGIQVVEVNVDPAPAVDWFWSVPILFVVGLLVGGAISMADQGIRALEREYILGGRSRSTSASQLGSVETPDPTG